MRSALERFNERVIKQAGGCWLFDGPPNASGYGTFYLNGRMRLAHRAAWMLMVGSVPGGRCVLHRCDVRLCVNPDHLFLGTQADNNKDRDEKGRQQTHRGEASSSAMLTERQIRAIRELVAKGNSQYLVADAAGTTQTNVSLICSRKAWAHVS